MHSFLKQSTASQSRSIGPFLDDTDFKTAETGLTIANTDIKLMVNGGASADKNSGGGTHRANGVYGVTSDATDTATVGEMFVSVKVAGALPVFATFVVLEEAVYDALFAASAPGYGTAQTGDSFARLGAPAGASVSADVAAVKSDTAAILVDTGTTLQAEIDGIQADTEDIQTRLPAALVAGRIDASVGATAANVMTAAAAAADLTTELQSGLATAAALATVDTVVDGIATTLGTPGDFGSGTSTLAANLQDLADNGTATFDRATDSLQAIRDRGDAAWITATGFSTLDAAGVRSAVGLASANLDTQLADIPTNAELTTAVANVSVDEIQATALADLFNTDSLTTYASAVAGSVVKEIADNAGGSALTAAAIADAVWDEAQADHVAAGSFGETATEIAAILVDTGTTLQAELDGIQADTEDIQSRLPDVLVSGSLKANITHVIGDPVQQNGSTTTNWGGAP